MKMLNSSHFSYKSHVYSQAGSLCVDVCFDSMQYTVNDDEDLAHYQGQPERMMEEFRRMKIVKRKAEQFAIEAKQAAQKVYRHCSTTQLLMHFISCIHVHVHSSQLTTAAYKSKLPVTNMLMN